MRAMLLERLREPLKLVERPDPLPSVGEVRVQVDGLRRLPDRPSCC